MRRTDVKLGGPRLSTRRIAAMAVAIGCHTGLLLVVLCPARPLTGGPVGIGRAEAILELRLATTSPRISSLAKPRIQSHARTASANARKYKASINAPPPAAATSHASEKIYVTPDQLTGVGTSPADGGFHERLSNAQHLQDIRGVPGSDIRVTPGLELTAPMNQGVGAVMRSTQRLFGIPDRHCVDVEVLQHLSPDELSARHLSPPDLRREADKYNCNQPLGLHF